MGLDNPIHLALLLMVLLLVFGAKRLPEMGRSLGHGLRGFKEAVSGQELTHTLSPAEMVSAAAEPATVTPVIVSQSAE
jgi:sec-independent protein translocase protein TatA